MERYKGLPAMAGRSLEEDLLRFAKAAMKVNLEADAPVFEMAAALTHISTAASRESQGPVVFNQVPDLGIADLPELRIQSSLESCSSYN